MNLVYNADATSPFDAVRELTNVEVLEHNLAVKEKEAEILMNELSKITKMAIEKSKDGARKSFLEDLFEHFIVKNELEDQFIDFLKGVAEKEKVEEYRKAAEWKFNLYHYDYNGESHYFIEDHYGWMKEEEESFED